MTIKYKELPWEKFSVLPPPSLVYNAWKEREAQGLCSILFNSVIRAVVVVSTAAVITAVKEDYRVAPVFL